MSEDPKKSADLLYFRAGYLAAEHSLEHAELAVKESLQALDPSGPPLFVAIDSCDITVEVARTLAAVAGAGRQVFLISPTGETPPDARPWLGDRIKVLRSSTGDGNPSSISADGPSQESEPGTSSVDIQEQTTVDGSSPHELRKQGPSEDGPFAEVPHLHGVDPPDAPGDYCGVEWAAGPLAQGGSQGSNYLDRLAREFKLEGTREGATFTALFPSTPNTLASWIEFGACRASGREKIMIRTSIAVTPSGQYWSSGERDAFGWFVLRWTEQPVPKKTSSVARWIGRSQSSAKPFEDEAACFPGRGDRPQRFMSLSTQLIVARADDVTRTKMANLGHKSALTLEYRLPLVDWHIFKKWASTSITSLLRVLHLLYQPQWNLSPVRDVQSEGPAITRLLSSQRALPYGLAGPRLAGSEGEPVEAPGPVNRWPV